MKKVLFLFVAFIVQIYSANAQYTKILDFVGTNGRWPLGDLVSDGTFLYGMTSYGGIYTTNCIGYGCGVLFKIKPDGTGYSKLVDFNSGPNGGMPKGSLIYDGNFLYGTTWYGGSYNYGTVFKIRPDGTGDTVLFNFNNLNGNAPVGSLVSDSTYLYGMTQYGGDAQGDGTVFKIRKDGTRDTTLLKFNGINGKNPTGSLIIAGEFLFGMTYNGGVNDSGVVFKIKKDGTDYSKLMDFAGAANGGYPYGSLILDSSFLYGMTSIGGTFNNGTIFKIETDGTGYLKLLNFSGNTSGCTPYGSLVLDSTFLYGMTAYCGNTNNNGMLFRINKDGTGFVKLNKFNYSVKPYGALISDGTFLYGMSEYGGSNNTGTVFKWNTKEILDSLSVCVNYSNCASAFPFGGTPPYTFLWSNGDTTSTTCATNNEDTLIVTIKDYLGYSRIDTAILTWCLDDISQYSKFNTQVYIYPNPTSENLIIESSQKAIIEILTIEGQIINTTYHNSHATTFDLTGFSSGIYIVKVKTDKEIITRKIIKE